MDRQKLKQIDDTVLGSLGWPSVGYIAAILICVPFVIAGLIALGCQYDLGMGVTGLSIPVGWAVYIANYVFWIAVAMSGTFISAMLYLFRVRWRNAVNRIAETMTIFAIMVAGMFPLVHLGRVWVFWWILPYPNWRHLWPNFKSPLVLDVLALLAYLSVSLMFFYLGLIPDFATARDKAPEGRRRRLYALLAMGWTGRYEQWRHYARGYLALAAVSMPLAMSVHSVVSWDFAMGLLPGWHSTFFAPYFVAGAIHSGLATIIMLLVPIRKALHMESIFKQRYLEQIGLMMILTGSILAYSYANESFMDWYSGSTFSRYFNAYRAYGSWYYSSIFWLVVALNCALPMTLFFSRLRKNLAYLLMTACLVNLAMFLERYLIVIVPLTRGFLPSSWGIYAPMAPEILITGLAFGGFIIAVLVFVKLFPSASITEVKKQMLPEPEEAR